MKLRIRYAKAVCLSVIFIATVSAVYFGITKLSGQDISLEGYTMMLAMSGILLHFMYVEDKEEQKDEAE